MPALREVFRQASWSNEGDRPLLTRHPEFLEFSDNAVREGRTQVAILGGQVVGFYSIVPSETVAELEDLFVDPEWMRRGVGTALVEHAVAASRLSGLAELAVNANSHALAFYRRVGFMESGPVPLEHGTAIRMRRSTTS
jgi:GNAT superfamily N-acetyltransferase